MRIVAAILVAMAVTGATVALAQSEPASRERADSARAIEGQAPSMRERMNGEILRLANRDERFAQAILDWYEANQQYEAARKRRND